MTQIKVPFFDAYWQKREVEALKRDAEEYRSLIERMLEEVKVEQQIRLRTICEKGPWEPDWEVAALQLKERALQTLLRLKRYRNTLERVRQIEEKLPPATGLNRLRYVNPWIFTWILFGISIFLWR